MDLTICIAPPDQSFEADDTVTADIDFRLKCAAKFAIADCEPKQLFGSHAARVRLIEFVIEEH